MLWEYKLQYIGRILGRVPTNKDWHPKNIYIHYLGENENVYKYNDWVWTATLNYKNNVDYIEKKIVLLELERKTIINNTFPEKFNKTYIKCLITNPYENNKTYIDWVDIDWVMPLITETLTELKQRLAEEIKNEIKLKKHSK